MKWRRLLSLRRWSHMFSRIWRYLVSPHVAIMDKLLFLVPVVLYWVLPDVMPFIPIDDIGVTMLMTGWFVSRMDKNTPVCWTTVRFSRPKVRCAEASCHPISDTVQSIVTNRMNSRNLC